MYDTEYACPNCGEIDSEYIGSDFGGAFCIKCGTPLGNEDSETPTHEILNKKGEKHV